MRQASFYVTSFQTKITTLPAANLIIFCNIKLALLQQFATVVCVMVAYFYKIMLDAFPPLAVKTNNVTYSLCDGCWAWWDHAGGTFLGKISMICRKRLLSTNSSSSTSAHNFMY